MPRRSDYDKNRPWANPNFDPDKAPLYKHDPFMRTFPNNVKVSCDENGKVTIAQDHSDGSFDEVVISASVIYKTSMLLYETRHSKLVSKEEIREELEKDK